MPAQIRPSATASVSTPVISVSPDSLADSLYTGGHSTHTISITNEGSSDLNFEVSLELIAEPPAVLSVEQAVASMATRSELVVGQEMEDPSMAPADGLPNGDAAWPANVAYASQSAGAPSSLPEVALLAADYQHYAADVQDYLLATGRFGSVSVIDVRTVTPTLVELEPFDAVLVWSNFVFADRVALGDALAAYVDAGGGVVCAFWEMYSGGSLRGRWESERYFLIERGDYRCCDNSSLGVVEVPFHPTMAGVSSFDGGDNGYRPGTSSLTAGSTLIASWSDGTPLVAAKSLGGIRRVDLGFFPPSSRVGGGFWRTESDGDLLLANALEWTSHAWIASEADSGSVAAGAHLEFQFAVDASWLVAGDYRANVLISSNDPIAPVVTLPVHLHVTDAPDLAVSESVIDFGITYTGTTTVDTLPVYNAGAQPLAVSLTAIPSEFSVDPTDFSVGPGALQRVLVAFAPSTTGAMNGTLTLFSDDPDEPVVVVLLTGAGLDPPVIVVSPDSVMDSLLTGETSTHGLTVANAGLSDLRFDITCERIDSSAAFTVDEAVLSLARRGSSLEDPGQAARASALPRPPEDMEPSPRGAVARTTRPATVQAGAPDVAILAADYEEWVSDVEDHLLSSGRFASVSVIDARVTTPGLSELLAFDAVLVWSQLEFEQRAALGDTLAAYVDAGGGVVCAMFESIFGLSLGGRWESERYYLIERNSSRCCDDESFGVVTDPFHPVMAGVTSFDGGPGSYRPDTKVLTAGSWLVASWSDGMPLVVTRIMPVSRRVDLGFFPPSSRVTSDFWDADTDGDLLLANALEWVSTSWIEVDPDSGIVPAGGQRDIALGLDAAGLLGGDYRANVRIRNNDPLAPSVVVPARLHVTGVPDIAVSHALLDYGNTFTGTTAIDTLVIRNVGTDLLSVSAVSTDEADFSAGPGGFSLAPGAEYKLAVAFAPGTTGVIQGTLSISSDDPDQPVVQTFLTGIALDPPVIAVTPDSLSDSLRVGETSVHQLTLTNSGATELVFDVRFDAAAAPNAARVAPDAGPDVALLAADYPEYVADVQRHLLGTGAFDSVTWIDVASVVPGLAELQSFDAVLVWSDLSFANREALGDTLAAYVDAGGGVVSALFESSGSTALGGRWEADRYYIVERFGSRCCNNATLGVVSAPLHPLMAGVSSFDGGPACYRPNSASLMSGSILVASWSDGMPLVATREIGPARRVELGFFPPSSDAYSEGWQAETDGDLLMANALAWVALPWLSAQPPSGTVPAGGTLDISLTFDATRVYGGDHAANIGVRSNDPVTPEVIVPARLHVTGIADIELSDVLLLFGARFLGTESADTLVVSNVGSDELAVTIDLSAPSEFDVSNESFSLVPGESKSLVVTFAPVTTGEKSGAIVIHCNDPDEPEVTVALSGIGLESPALSVSDDSLADSLFVGETHTRLLTLTNTGYSDLVFGITVEKAAPPPIAEADALDPPSGVNVVMLTSSTPSYVDDVRQMLLATGKFNLVSTMDARYQTPDIVPLMLFDAVLIWNDSYYQNATALGNVLADYVDAGGGVVCALYESTGNQWGRLGGRWESGVYNVLSRGPSKSGSFTSLGDVHEPRHPLMYAVRAIEGGSGSFRPATANLTPGSTLIAAWSDGMPLVATKQMALARRVDLGFYPPSSNVRYDSWQASTDGDQLMANALVWVSRSWLNVEPGSGTLAAGAQLDLAITYDASRLDAGEYLARLVFQSNDPILPRLELRAQLHVMPAIPGDCNGDGHVGANDILHLVNHVFKNGPSPRGQTGDFSCDFAVTVVDIIELVNHVFKGGTIETCP